MSKEQFDFTSEKITEENLQLFIDQGVKLYNKTNYEEACRTFEKLSAYDNKYHIILTPYLGKCKNVINSLWSDDDKRHIENMKVLKKYGWVDYLKYVTAPASFSFLLAAISKWEAKFALIDLNFNGWLEIFAFAFLLIMTIAIHLVMRKYTGSRNLIRCKYCGHYTKYVNPNASNFLNTIVNLCRVCKRTYPVPDFYWDSWEGLEYMKQAHSVPEPEFYDEFAIFCEKHKNEFETWRLNQERLK